MGARMVGRELLWEAIANTWRELPDNILLEYARLCVQRDGE